MNKKRVSINDERNSPKGLQQASTDHGANPSKILKKQSTVLTSPPPFRARSNLKGVKKRLQLQTNQVHYNKYSNLEESKICQAMMKQPGTTLGKISSRDMLLAYTKI